MREGLDSSVAWGFLFGLAAGLGVTYAYLRLSENRSVEPTQPRADQSSIRCVLVACTTTSIEAPTIAPTAAPSTALATAESNPVFSPLPVEAVLPSETPPTSLSVSVPEGPVAEGVSVASPQTVLREDTVDRLAHNMSYPRLEALGQAASELRIPRVESGLQFRVPEERAQHPGSAAAPSPSMS